MSSKDHQILRVAELYYKQEISQQEISKMLGFSRPTVSRMIQEAKKRGLVKITINTPVELDYKLSEQLKNQFHLKDVLVVKAEEENSDETLNRVGYVAARFLLSLLEDDGLVGISWGKTMKQVVDSIPETDLSNIKIIQLVGSLGSGNPAIDGPELAYKLADRLKGSYKYINSPAVVSNEQVKNALLHQQQIEEVLEAAKDCSIVIMGVGSLSEEFSSLHRSGYLDEAKRKDYIKEGAVGHILAQMINEKGEVVDLPNNYVIGVPLESLKNKQWSIGVVANSFKTDSILAAVRGRYINSLVIDEFTAKQMLEQ
ncbi:sugar-binding transcriptional regulator [Bacillus sp. B15-48]|uniref:sugar-binding transcriptional regulator n=1 Tax=Bacillus sp. B15-48 TaxID=1548601 RepID=UPI00193F093F|nr:sugar-binding transcriptional regulator [Bacillus sp. B15-48]MBM4761101.1 helix-turn-helix domain-containing protein [Bacillus sp. B15-48]